MNMRCLNLLFVAISFSQFSHGKICSDINYRSQTVINFCLVEGKITNLRTYECHEANRQGGCEAGERLVINGNGDCKTTHCINNRDDYGEPCPDGQIAYRGRCELVGSKSVCDERNKRLFADEYGAVSCVCPVELGYVEVGEVCYHQHFRGPCDRNQSLQRHKETGDWGCVQDTCDQGQVMWDDGRCYEVKTAPEECEDIYELITITGEETVTVDEGENVEDIVFIDCISKEDRASGTFESCAARSSIGMCLAKRKPPKVKKNANLDFII